MKNDYSVLLIVLSPFEFGDNIGYICRIKYFRCSVFVYRSNGLIHILFVWHF